MGNMRFKVGDRVRIKSLDWYNENKDKYGTIYTSNGFCFCDDMTKHCGDIMKIIDIIVDPKDSNQGYYIMDNVKKWTDEMIECKVGEETKPKFKVGDILFYRGETCGYLKVEEIRVENGEIRYYENSRNVYLVENDPEVFADKVCSVETEETRSENKLLDDYEELTDRAFKGGYEKCKSDIELNGFQLPEGYIFKDENGDEILTSKIILEKKKKEYPKTYDECCEVLGYEPDEDEINCYQGHLIESFVKLLICRDAYWKIAGEEMGLGKPWEPIFDIDNNHFVITVHHGEIEKFFGYTPHDILVFPTAEMRDAFYENFKEEIEICKELL